MASHKGVEYQVIGSSATIYWFGEMLPVEQREGRTLHESARMDIEELCSRGTTRNKFGGKGHEQAPNPAWIATDAVLEALRGRNGFDALFKKMDEEIENEIRAELADVIATAFNFKGK